MKRDSLRSIMAAVAIALTVFALPVRAAVYDAEAEEVCESASEEQIPEKEESDQTNEDTALPLSGETGTEEWSVQREAEPQVEEADPEPQPEEDIAELQVEEADPEPQPEEDIAEPQVEEANPEPQVEEADPEPQSEEAITEPQVEEADPEPQPEEARTVQKALVLKAVKAVENGIPVLNLTIDPDEFQKVLDSPDHSYRANEGTVRIELPEGYTGEFGDIDPSGIDTELVLEFIRGRGNSTWGAGKNPFKIKLDKSTDLLGMGKNKHWVLLANYYDTSHLRNRIAAYMGRELGLEFTPEMVPVDFYVNGEYIGSYTFGEEIRIGKNRVDIDEIDPSATSGEEITGGYLLALQPYYDEPEENKFTTEKGVKFLMDGPVFDDSDPDKQAAREQYDYITDYLQKTENAIFGEGGRDENGVSYTEYLDIDSAAKYWWVQQLCKNTDAYKTPSSYLYKKRDGKLYFGPLWDFDYSMLALPLEGANPINDQKMAWLDHLRENDPQFQEALRRAWQEYDPIIGGITDAGGLLDRYKEEIRASWKDDFDRWSSDPSFVGTDLEEDTELIRDFLTNMRRLVNDNIGELLTIVNCTITYKNDDETVASVTVRSGSPYSNSFNEDKPEKEGFLFKGWVTEDGRQPDSGWFVNKDLVLKADFIRDKDATRPDYIFFEPYDKWISVDSEGTQLFYTLVPADVQDTRVSWTVSDPEIAEIADMGGWFMLKPKKVGEAVITAAMKSGIRKSLALHVYDPADYQGRKLTELVPSEKELKLYVGESGQMRFLLTPGNASTTLIYSSGDENIVSIDSEYGVVTGLTPGTCRITVMDLFSGIETQYTVVVLERTEPEEDEKEDKPQDRPENPEEEIKPEKPERDGDKEPEDVKPDPDKTEPEDGKEEGNNQETEKSDEKEEEGGDVTDTGDDSDPWVFGALLMFSLMGIFVIKRKQVGAARNAASWRE